MALMNWEISSDLDTCVQEILRGKIRLQAQIVLNEEPKAYVAQLLEDKRVIIFCVWRVIVKRNFLVIIAKEMDISFLNVLGVLSEKMSIHLRQLSLLYMLSST